MSTAAQQKSRDRLVGNLIVVIPAIALLVLIRRFQTASGGAPVAHDGDGALTP